MKIAGHSHNLSRISRILVIQLGDIGDVVWSLPALWGLRRACPEAEIAVLLREGNGTLLKADRRPLELFEVRKGEGGRLGRLMTSLRLVLALRRKRFDIVFDLRGDERGGYMAFATGAPVRVAQFYALLRWPRNSLFTHLMTFTEHGIEERAATSSLGILRAFGIEVVGAVPELRLSEEVRGRAEALLAEAEIPPARQVVTLNPFSRWAYKEWSPRKWALVIDRLWQEFGMASVIVGSPAERERAQEIGEACSGKVFNLAGKTTLAELAGVLEQSRLHIGVDSAAPHIAAAVGTPTVTLYGPSDGLYWAPPGKRHRIVASGMDCAPCRRKGCEDTGVSRCLETLPITPVLAAIRESLGESLAESPQS